MITSVSCGYLDGAPILITGGTGSLGRALVRIILENAESATIVIYSRGEFKQFQREKSFALEEQDRLRMCLGDVRDAPAWRAPWRA